MGSLHYFLGIEVHHDEDCLFLSQSKCASDLLKFTDMLVARAIQTPLSQKHTLHDLSAAALQRSNLLGQSRSLASLAAELNWVIYLLKDIRISLSHPPLLFTDNISALHLTSNSVLHA
ncbi:hypothetical protein KY285_026624 [Solanum tuberosum]|nr:hypothetical protein KY285_026624 [Solanum tuberosum]